MTAPSAPTHTMIVMEMLSAANRFGVPWVHIDDIARRLYPGERPPFYAASIRSTIGKVRQILAEHESGVVFADGRYALAIHLPGIFRAGQGFVRRPSLKRRVDTGIRARFAPGVTPRAGR